MHTSIHTLPCVISSCRKMSLWSVHSCISLFILPPLQTVDSLSNKKQMGDLCCGLLPNGANSHYNVCKLCLFSPSFTSTPCTTLPSDVLNTCFRCRRVILICLVLLITGCLSFFSRKWETDIRHDFSVGLLIVTCYLAMQTMLLLSCENHVFQLHDNTFIK